MNIEESFTDQLCIVFSKCLERQRRLLSNKSFPSKDVDHQSDRVIQRLENPEKEIERVLENLHLLPFTAFGVRYATDQSRGRLHSTYLLGVTQPIYVRYELFTPAQRLETHLEYLGKYIIAVPIHAVLTASLGGFHFIPLNSLHSPDRHYHHRALINPDAINPLDHQVETCWGSVGALMLNALSLVDIPAIFESGLIFLERINNEDVLARPLARRVSIETYMRAKRLTYRQYIIEGCRDINDIF